MDTSASNTSEPVFQLRSLSHLAQAEHFHKNKSIAGGICRTDLQCSGLRNKSSKQLWQQPILLHFAKNTNEEKIA